jgi:insulysin
MTRLINLVYHDAANIKALTKDDMIQFFAHYISPSSPARSKLAVHLLAQGVSEAPSPAVKPQGVVEKALDEAMDQLGLQSEACSKRKPYMVENVRDFKSLLAVSAGPQPVKDLSEFEGLDSKL